MGSVTIRVPEPTAGMFGGLPEIRLIGVVSNQEITNAGGLLVCRCPVQGVRVMNAKDAADGVQPLGMIAMGYGDIPAKTPFWITTNGPAFALTSDQRPANTSSGESQRASK